MINPQLLDFIKQQLLKGVDKVIITKELLGSGWEQKDIEEGFNEVNSFVVNPTVNPVINPDIYNDINNPILTQATNHSGKKVLLVIVTLFIIAGVASGYYFRNDIPIIKDLIKNNAIPVSEIIQEDNDKSQIEQEKALVPEQEQNQDVEITDQISSSTIQATKSIILPEKDCGFSNNTPEIEAGFEFSYKGDPALKCFGESALNCTNAKVVITGGNSLDKNPALLQIIKNDNVCYLKFTGYQKKYTQCPISLASKEIDREKSNLNGDNPILVFKDIDTNNPEKYAASLFSSMMLMPLISDDQYQKIGCTGELYKVMSDAVNLGQNKMIEDQLQRDIAQIRTNVLMATYELLNIDYKGVCLNYVQPYINNNKSKNPYLKNFTCFDSADSYAVSISSPINGFLCEDGDGYPAITIQKNITGPTCQ